MESKTYKIICNGYPVEFSLDKNVAKEYFKQFGQIRRVVFRKKTRSCIVEYENQEHYLKALNNAGDYKGVTFNVSSFTDDVSKLKKKVFSENMWIDNEEVEAELAAMSGQATKLNKSQEGSLQDTSKYEYNKSKKNWKSETKPKKNIKSKENIDLTVSSKEVEFVKLIFSQALNAEDKYRILEARDKLIKLKLKRNPPIKASATVGTCPDMCPEKERLFREIKHQVAWYEQDDNGKSMDHGKAVKQYSRSSADQEAPLPHELRPVAVLQMTMGYLLHNIVDLCDKDEIHLGEWFHFLWDRMRGIRKDITQQELCSQGAVELVEQCSRFHIHCSARLVAEDASVFDQKINTENLTKCLQTLKYMYHDLALKGETCQNEAEFRAYVILLNLNDGNFMWEVQQLRREIQRSKEVQFAMKVYSAIDKNNYIKFFKLLYSTSYLNACILMRYFNQVRIAAIKTLNECCVPRGARIAYPLDELNKSLAFDDIDSTKDFLNYCGLAMNGGDAASVILKKTDFVLPSFSYMLDRSNVVEQKRNYSVGRIVCGKDLPEKIYQIHHVEDSFDLNGYLVNNDILDDIDLEKIKLNLLEELKNEGEPKEKIKNKSLFTIVDTVPEVKEEKFDNPFTSMKRHEKVDSPFVFVKKKNNKIENIFGIAKKEEKIDNLFSFANRKDDVDNPFASEKKEEKFDIPFSFVKKEENFGNPFALGNKEISKAGSIFDTTPPSPKSVFSFVTPIGVQDLVPFRDQTDSFDSVNEPVPMAVLEQKPEYCVLKKGGFKFDLIIPSNKKTDEIPPINYHSIPKITFTKTGEKEKIIGGLEKKDEDENLKMLEEESAVVRLKRLSEEKLEEQKILERKKQEAERLLEEKIKEKNLEEQIKEEKRLRDLKRKMQEEELTKRLQKIKREEQLKELEIKNSVKHLISSLVSRIDNEFREEKLNKIKENIEKKLLKTVFYRWKIAASKNARKRKAMDCSPMWINTKTLKQSADGLHVHSQDLTLALSKRYKYGEPLNFDHLFEEDVKIINLYQLTYSILKNRIYELTVSKPKNIFWKVAISFPNVHEVSVGLNRWVETMESAFQWKKQQQRWFHIEHIDINSLESVTYCVEKQEGYNFNQFDANGIIFLAKNFDANLQKRIYENLKGFGRTKVPIVIVLREGNPSDCYLDKLIEQNIGSDYLVLIENSSLDYKLVDVVEEGLMFLAKNVDSSPPLELDTLKSFVSKYLCSEIWKRANSFSKWNMSYKKCLQKPSVVLSLYNEALTKLKTIIFNSDTRYITFPEEFKIYLNSEVPDFLPCSFRYFPSFSNTQTYSDQLEDMLKTLILPNWSDNWPPPNKYELERSVAKYASKVSNQPEKLFLKIMSLLLRQVDPNENFGDIEKVLWTEVVSLIGLEKLNEIDFTLNRNSILFKEYFVIYNKNELSEYIFCDWFYICHPKIRKLVEENLEEETALKIDEVPVKSEQLNVSEDVINSFWNVSLKQRLDKSDMIKDMNRLKRTIDDLATNMAVHKRISNKVDENLKRAIAEK